MKGVVPKIRELPAMKAIEEGIGRSAEMGRPAMYVSGFGLGGLSTNKGPGHMAGLGILNKIAETSAELGVDLICALPWPEQLPIADAIVRQAYLVAGHPEGFKPENVRYTAPQSWGHTLSVMGMIERERPSAVFPIGAFSGEALLVAWTSYTYGAFQVGGTDSVSQMTYFAAVCDFVFVGPEIYAGEAVATGNPVLLGSIFGEDIIKYATVIGLLVLTAIVAFGGIRI